MKLTIVPASLVARPKPGGLGYNLCREGTNYATFSVGNVTVAFSGPNNWDGRPDSADEVIELSENTHCPVKVGDVLWPACDDPAVTLLRALASDLGYSISRDG